MKGQNCSAVLVWWCVVRQFYKLPRCAGEVTVRASSEYVHECASALRASITYPTSPAAAAAGADDDALASLLHTDLQSVGSLASVTSDEAFIAYESATGDSDDWAVAVCTPLMKRVHRLVPQAGDVVMVDVGPPVDKRRRCRVVVLVTSSSVGGLPLGVVAASTDTRLTRAVQLYSGLLDSRCFYGRGQRGPTLLLVDDCPAVRTALTDVFTESSCLLCTYRLLVSYWRELWDRRSAISTEQRAHCLAVLRAALFADTVDELHASFASAERELTSLSSGSYVTSVYQRRADWSVCCQTSDWPALSCAHAAGATRGLSVCASRTLKDAVLEHVESMKTLATLVTFVSSDRVDRYYRRRLMDTLMGRVDDAAALRFMQTCDMSADVLNTGPSQWAVTLRSSTSAMPDPACDVDLTVGVCSCSAGCDGRPCAHQWAAVLHTRAQSWLLRPVSTTAARRLLAHIATGRGYAEPGWFALSHPLQSSADHLALVDDVLTVTAPDTFMADTAGQEIVSSTPAAAAGADSLTDTSQLVINWNGLTYEVNLQDHDATLTLEPNNAPSRHRLRQAFDKIETAYLNHADVMETAVSAFCQNVESIEVLEHLNSAMLCFGNSFLTSGSAALSWS